ncbi:YkuS family protein [Paenibacillus sp. 32O-W]|uniref:YkuS family protein n=1 Tax=Paenibacillus sp. 32O-W TaxID=1695218 RepID=UPI0011A6E53B|nr:YkuS family protein [Paenibacillus sp. 32O-W]
MSLSNVKDALQNNGHEVLQLDEQSLQSCDCGVIRAARRKNPTSETPINPYVSRDYGDFRGIRISFK